MSAIVAWFKDWATAVQQRSPYEDGYLAGLGDGVSIGGSR